jgi:hypothetical protein
VVEIILSILVGEVYAHGVLPGTSVTLDADQVDASLAFFRDFVQTCVLSYSQFAGYLNKRIKARGPPIWETSLPLTIST